MQINRCIAHRVVSQQAVPADSQHYAIHNCHPAALSPCCVRLKANSFQLHYGPLLGIESAPHILGNAALQCELIASKSRVGALQGQPPAHEGRAVADRRPSCNQDCRSDSPDPAALVDGVRVGDHHVVQFDRPSRRDSPAPAVGGATGEGAAVERRGRVVGHEHAPAVVARLRADRGSRDAVVRRGRPVDQAEASQGHVAAEHGEVAAAVRAVDHGSARSAAGAPDGDVALRNGDVAAPAARVIPVRAHRALGTKKAKEIDRESHSCKGLREMPAICVCVRV